MKTSDVEEAFSKLFQEIHALRQELETIRDKERSLKAYTAEEAAKLIGFHPKTIRKMVRKKLLTAVYAISGRGSYRITWHSIQEYLNNRGQKGKIKK